MKGYLVVIRFNNEPTTFYFRLKKERDSFIRAVLRDFKEEVKKEDIIYTTEKVEIGGVING